MSDEDVIIDYVEEYQDPEMFLASAGNRLANFFLDRIGVYLFIFLMANISDVLSLANDGLSDLGAVIFILCIPGYWILSEYYFDKTPAKFITRTKVVMKDGTKPSFWTIVGRTLCRFIPFEPFSFLGSKAIGWHDSITNTRVVSDNFKTRISEFY